MATTKTQKAINKGLKVYGGSKSAQNRRILNSIRSLNTARETLVKRLEQRSLALRKTLEPDQKRIAELTTIAENCRRDLETNTKTGNAALIAQTATSVKVAEQQLENAKSPSFGVGPVLAKWSDRFEQDFLEWIDQCIMLSLRVLKGNISIEAAIAILSGGAIVAGLMSNPLLITTGTVISISLMLDQLRNFSNKARTTKADAEKARQDTAIILMDGNRNLIEQLLKILK